MGGFVLLRIEIPVGMLLLFKCSRRVKGRGREKKRGKRETKRIVAIRG